MCKLEEAKTLDLAGSKDSSNTDKNSSFDQMTSPNKTFNESV